MDMMLLLLLTFSFGQSTTYNDNIMTITDKEPLQLLLLLEVRGSSRYSNTVISDALENYLETLHIVNVESNGNILYTWKGNQGHTYIGLYDCHTEKNQHLYTFEKDLHVISCSVNNENTLLAVSFLQSTKEEKANLLLLQPGTRNIDITFLSKCLTLLIEIHPVNNVKVLKAVDSCIRVQFLYPVAETNTSPESCLLLISEDKYVEKIDIRVVKDGHRVVIENSSQLSRQRIVDDLIWAQWDRMEQRLFYIVPKLEAPLDISLTDIAIKPTNLDYSCHQDQEIIPKPLNVQVVTSETGSAYMIPYELSLLESMSFVCSLTFHVLSSPRDEPVLCYSKTYTVALDEGNSLEVNNLIFLNLDYYVVVYLPGHFLHILNTQHPDLMCYSFFLTGGDAKINGLHTSTIISPLKSMVLDCSTGRVFTVAINKEALLQFLWNSKLDSDRMAALHCLLLHVGSTREIETQVIHWISDNTSICFKFDPIQEFIIASLYWTMCLEAISLDRLLPYTPLLYWNEDVPGIICGTHIISLPVLKVQHCKGFWEKLSTSLECVKYAEPHLHFSYKLLRRECDKLLSDERSEERTTYMKNIFGNAKSYEERLVPLFHDEDYHQQLLTGLMVTQLKDHLMRHLQYIGTKKIEQIAVDYVSKMLGLICQIMENVWQKYNLHSWTFSLKQGNSEEIAVFRIMCQILQAANGM
ncbi:hypothetical protein JD844_027591 [Phrynosoma platyrhinos]|uniref:Gamma-secretase-activating protein n=1 Tax=Phrynosoma platyrhinos TaxID=52577 RepID=A0ABQ7SGP2_PHRPL|nr:hypothetical protein JD844_027591 [Phrynosoma platyrhinos]